LSGRTPALAVAAFKAELQQVLSCVTDAVLGISRSEYKQANTPHTVSLGLDSVPLAGPARISLLVDQAYRIKREPSGSRSWVIETAGYRYAIRDADDREVVSYHCHPEGHSFVTTPHIHLGYGAMIGRPELTRAHLPTGLINLADLLRLAVEDFQVRPLRSDWGVVLAPAASQSSGESS